MEPRPMAQREPSSKDSGVETSPAAIRDDKKRVQPDLRRAALALAMSRGQKVSAGGIQATIVHI
jgi:hypothetical protein